MSAGAVTTLLRQLESGDRSALHSIVPLVYEELHGIAVHQMRSERSDHTLQPTALVNEAIVSIVRRENPAWRDGTHFLRSAAAVMRSILVSHARARNAHKRGGANKRLPLDDVVGAYEERVGDLAALDEALQRLAELNPRHAELVELRFFAGVSLKEAAGELGISERTAKSDWSLARQWLWSALRD